MPISDKLSYSLGRKDQAANKKLAQEIVDAQDTCSLNEIVDLFHPNSPRRLQMDAILTIAKIGEREPEMLVPYVHFLILKLSDKIDRVAWGSMIALSHVSPLVADEMFTELPAILDGMARSSVVGRDYGFRILVKVYQIRRYRDDVFCIILEQLRMAPSNQVGQYTECLLSVIEPVDIEKTITVLEEKRKELEDKHHIKRLDKNLKKLYDDRVE